MQSVAADGPRVQERTSHRFEPVWVEQFRQWLQAGGYAPAFVRSSVAAVRDDLSAASQPCELDTLVPQVLAQLATRSDLSAHAKQRRLAQLAKVQEFRLFLRGKCAQSTGPPPLPRRVDALPTWLREPLSRYLQLRQRTWPAHSARQQTQCLASQLGQIFSFFLQQYAWTDWSQLSLRWVDAYVDAGLQRGLQVATLNVALGALQMFCRFLREEGYAVPQPLTQLKALTMPRHLPRPLSDEQVRRLEQQFQSQLSAGPDATPPPQAIMDLACFYLLWHCGLRISEVQRLEVNDLDLSGRKLLVRNSKERKDRVVYLSDTAVAALRQHLSARLDAQASALFTQHHRRLSTRTLSRHLVKQGQAIKLAVSPHRLRHTFATQMLNAGMPITSLQRYLGHEALDTTMVYAGVSDRSLQEDYYHGMIAIDPPSASLLPSGHKAALRNLLAELQTRKQTTAQRQALLEQMQALLADEHEHD
jgi:site-specific recombinase XerD